MKKKSPLVSVIVPSFKEGTAVGKNLAPLQRDPRIEVIVIDAEKAGRANRAYQMNLGASASGGRAQTLVFLHVDTKIRPEDLWIIHQKLQGDPTIVGGAFRFALDENHLKARVVEFGVLLRELIFQLPYGDQGIFVRRKTFREVGGYPDVPLLEDVLLIQKIKEKGRLYLSPRKAVTSARRWERHGYFKTTLVNWATMILWRLGISLNTLQNLRGRAFS